MVKFSEHLTSCPSQTKKLGEALAGEILKKSRERRAIILGLKGDLGGGKTTFLQGFAKGLKIKEKILSPTFIIMRKLRIPGRNPKFNTFFHIDCYRIKEPREILAIGFREIISCPRNIVAIEWPEKIKKIIPENTTWIKFNFIPSHRLAINKKQFAINKKRRQIVIKNFKY